jgi:4a-hydroxytetrahydrobiopterin dehydratase
MVEEKFDLANERCEPPSGNEFPLPYNDAMRLLQSLHEAWCINNNGHLERVFLHKDFSDALNLANLLGKVAVETKHYPDMVVAYGLLRIEIWSHAINGLWRSDFVLAAKFDRASSEFWELS